MDIYTRQAALLKALAHPVRLKIAEILSQREACVCHLQAVLGLRQAYISQQLMVLRRAGWLSERRQGTYVFYRLADARAMRLLAAVRLSRGARARRRPPRRLAECGCPHCRSA
ncbi:MAG: metalloregulator ArsR/SmtB family transcription factor [Chloroflexota bacterium]